MDIFWEPKTSFKIVFSDSRTLFINPKKEVQADIVLSDEIKEEGSFLKDNTLFISSPGEYERKDIFVNAHFMDGDKGMLLYEISGDGLNLMFFGKLQKLPKIDSLDLFCSPDILIFPIGLSNLKPEQVRDLKKKLEPKFFILYLADDSLKDKLKNILDILDVEDIKPVKHIKIKPGSLPKDGQVVLFSSK